MKKNMKIILIIIVLIILVCGIMWFVTNKVNNSKNENDVEYVIISNYNTDYKSSIISDYKEYMEFMDYVYSQNKDLNKVFDFNFNKYNDEYFANKSLAIINIVTGSSMNKLNSIETSINDNLLICKVDIDYANGFVTDDIVGTVILVEIDKSVTEFIIEK